MFDFRSARTARQAGAIALAAALAAGSSARAQEPDPASGAQEPPATITIQLPAVVVTAQKEPADAQDLPLSVTAVTSQTLTDAGLTSVSEAAVYAPNTFFSEFSARKLSNPRFRGIGASPMNPAVTTYYDGVPQLHANTSSLDVLHVDQLEFVRGPQSALFGRNALGGVINITSRRPAIGGDWTGSALVPFGNSDERGVRLEASGPIVSNRVGLGVAFSYGERDGFTRNALTGNALDDRSAYAAKAQLRWAPAERWEARVIVSGERARDGDYALSDLGGLRANPFQTARDIEGRTERDVKAATILTNWDGAAVTLSTITGFVDWRTEDLTDLDYLPLPLVIRDNRESAFQFTQEVRLASPASAPVRLGDDVSLRWQAGVFAFTQDYDQVARNTYQPLFVSQAAFELLGLIIESPFPLEQRSPEAALDDAGVGVYGQGTLTFANRVDVTGGVRADYERKDASIVTSTDVPLFFPNTMVEEERGFSDVSPQASVAVRLRPGTTVYGSVARGFKAGGFNAVSPAGREAYEEEHTWSFEGGLKTTWLRGRVTANASVFRLDWDDLQLNLPDPLVPGQFFIDNAGTAASTGIELEVNALARDGVELFGSFGYTRARFDDGVAIGSVEVGGNEIPNTPDFTATVGTQLSHMLTPGGVTIYGRAETTVFGAYHYDEANTEGQDTYALTNVRAGVQFAPVFVEAWVRNAFDARYIPIAFEYRTFAPSGFVGEMGRPRTFGINAGVRF